MCLKQDLEQAFERLDRLSKHEKATRGIPTGFTDLDTTLSGLQKSDLIILAARPSLGKSALALDILMVLSFGFFRLFVFRSYKNYTMESNKRRLFIIKHTL